MTSYNVKAIRLESQNEYCIFDCSPSKQNGQISRCFRSVVNTHLSQMALAASLLSSQNN